MKMVFYVILLFTLSTSVIAQSKAKLMADKGREYYQSKDYKKAIDQYNEALKLRPNWPVIYLFRSDAKRLSGDLQGALVDVNTSIKYDSLNYKTYVRRARIFEDLKDYEKAIADFGKVLSLSKEYYQAYGSRAKLRMKTGDFVGVLEDYDALIAINPNLPQAYKLKARVLGQRKRYDEAIIHWDLALERNPDDGSSYYNRASNKLSLSVPDFKGACTDYELAKKHGIKEADKALKEFCGK